MRIGPKQTRLSMQDRDADFQEGTRLRSVRRRLFQDELIIPDEERNEGNVGTEDNLANSFLEETRRHREEAKKRWNFDFEKEEPLEGRWTWVKTDQYGNELSNSTATDGVTSSKETKDVIESGETKKEQQEAEKNGAADTS